MFLNEKRNKEIHYTRIIQKDNIDLLERKKHI